MPPGLLPSILERQLQSSSMFHFYFFELALTDDRMTAKHAQLQSQKCEHLMPVVKHCEQYIKINEHNIHN
uniref:Uncharacterized protein n=1 Tax=Panagrellus redivivus TaxID=6233 RepID=A0A7E4UTF8_PANRE